MSRIRLTALPSVVVISDWIEERAHDDGLPWVDAAPRYACGPAASTSIEAVEVAGSYLERLPLALVASGTVEQAEIWHFWRGPGSPSFHRDSAFLARRAFRIDGDAAPHASVAMEDFVRDFGAPHILVILGLGVTPALLDLCADSVIIYNSIDAPALRVPRAVSERVDLVLTGAQWQSNAVLERHPDIATAILPIGPEFAGADQFRPLGAAKDVDLIYVAAAHSTSGTTFCSMRWSACRAM